MRDLIGGETLTSPETKAEVRLTYAKAGTHIPIYPAVSGPKIHRLAGKVGDGAIVLVGVDPHFLQASRRELEAGAARSRHDSQGQEISRRVLDAVLDPGRWTSGAAAPSRRTSRGS